MAMVVLVGLHDAGARWFTGDERRAGGRRPARRRPQRARDVGAAGREGRILRPVFNGAAAALRPVVIPSWRATPVSPR